jgi:hypothetical protein
MSGQAAIERPPDECNSAELGCPGRQNAKIRAVPTANYVYTRSETDARRYKPACCRGGMQAMQPTCRGVITQPFWHVRFPRGTFEGAFGGSATTGGLHFTCCTRLSVHQFFLESSKIFRLF